MGALAKLSLVGSVEGMTKDNAKNLTFTYEQNGNMITGYAKVKWQGSSSLNWSKKNYTIDLYTDNTYSTKKSIAVSSWGKSSKYNLKANFIDATHARNVVNANLWKEVVTTRKNVHERLVTAPNMGAIDGFPINVYINGTLTGIYTMNIPKGNWMFNMDAGNPNHIAIVGEDSDTPSAMFEAPAKVDGSDWKMEFPDNLSSAGLRSFNNMINFITTTNNEADFRANFSKYIDLPAAIDYFVFQHAINNADGLAKNMLMFTYDGVIWIPSAYDLDSTWSLWWDGMSLFPYDYYCYEEDSLLWTKLKLYFKPELQARYAELRKNTLSAPNIIGKFEDFIGQIDPRDYEGDLAANPNIPSVNLTHIRQLRKAVYDRLAHSDKILLAGYVPPTGGGETPPDTGGETPPVETGPFETFEDQFNRPDSTQLGGAWGDDTGFILVSGKAVQNRQGLAIDEEYAGIIEMTSPDVIVETVATLSKWTGLTIRYVDEENFVKVEADGVNRLTLYVRINGSEANSRSVPFTINESAKIEIGADGNTYFAIVNDVEVIRETWIHPEVASSTKVGIATSVDVPPYGGEETFEYFKANLL